MNATTLLHRQVVSGWLQNGRLTSQAFIPTAKDKGRLSVYDGSLIAPGDAWRHYTGVLGYTSDGTMSVTSGDCDELDLPVESDPEPFPEHAVIVFEKLSKSQTRKRARKLADRASRRGWTYRPSE